MRLFTISDHSPQSFQSDRLCSICQIHHPAVKAIPGSSRSFGAGRLGNWSTLEFLQTTRRSAPVGTQSGGGAIEIACNSVYGGEMLERGQGRYVAALPAGVKLGPHSGTNRVHHSYQAG